MLVGTLLLAVAFEVFQCVCALHCTDFGITTSSSSHRVSTAVITMATVCQPHAAIVTNSRCNAAPGIFGRALRLVEAHAPTCLCSIERNYCTIDSLLWVGLRFEFWLYRCVRHIGSLRIEVWTRFQEFVTRFSYARTFSVEQVTIYRASVQHTVQ